MENAVLSVKEEEVVEVEEEGEVEEEVAMTAPQPLAGLQDSGPPPFLTKTFEMVEDPATDAVVSWSRARNSFVVWDSQKFATTLLPKYFKHSNFSSFIRQLNTYGFRKVDPDRWEFANVDFLGGQRHLLKNIKRRRNVGQSSHQHSNGGDCVDLGRFGLETEAGRLRSDRSVLMLEIVKLRQQQQRSWALLLEMERRVQGTERRQQQTMAFLARALRNPTFIKQLALQGQQHRWISDVGKKRRLPANASTEDLENLLLSSVDDGGSSIGGSQEDATTLESVDQSAAMIDDLTWEELLNESIIMEGETEDEEQCEVEVMVEGLAAEKLDWGEEVKDLVEQMGYLGSKP